MKVNMASYVEDLVKCGFLEMKLPRKQRKLTHKASFFIAVIFTCRLYGSITKLFLLVKPNVAYF